MKRPMLAFLIEKMPGEVNSVTYRGDSPLHAAVSTFSHIAGAIQLLIKGGADVNIRNSSFKSLLHIAAQRRCWKLVNALLLSGTADVDVQDAKGNTPLIICVQSHTGDDTRDNGRLLERLLQNDADVNTQNDDTHTALTFCTVLPKR
uniref:Uncharacterized protein n=1 Tax=Globisporangium ultimum (strain ATCC 200006 / CBS 805.95 / DAOM BR144) TaxID=431595 RepID=K3W7K4_GLOUD